MFRWNVRLEKMLRQLHSEGMLYEQIAEQLGCNPETARRKLIQLEIQLTFPSSPSSWSDQDIKKLKELVAQGLSYTQIARILGNDKTRNACIGKALRLGISNDKAPCKAIKSQSYILVDDRIIALFDEFKTATAFEIAEAIGIEFDDVVEYVNAKDRHRDLGSETSYRAPLVAEMRASLLEAA